MSGKVKELLEDERVKVLMSIMGDKYLYDIATALRGPDIKYTYMLKEVLTRTIRDIAACPDVPDDVIVARMNPVDIEMLLGELKDAEGDVSHYLMHISDAFQAFFHLKIIDHHTLFYVMRVIEAIDNAVREIEDTGKLSDNTFECCMDMVEKAFEKWKEVKGIE